MPQDSIQYEAIVRRLVAGNVRLAEPSGVDNFDGLYERAVVMDIDGLPVPVASIDDLIAMKRAANRPKDQVHIMTLEALKRLKESES